MMAQQRDRRRAILPDRRRHAPVQQPYGADAPAIAVNRARCRSRSLLQTRFAFTYRFDDFEIEGYDPHPVLKRRIAI
ncbi:hypothetical protein KCP75_15755 [Salmonella enterica subsp. enterica]|nr:hypothetical protein KCP75_15755 [Salmonella enterica subsp. enterica]